MNSPRKFLLYFRRSLRDRRQLEIRCEASIFKVELDVKPGRATDAIGGEPVVTRSPNCWQRPPATDRPLLGPPKE